MIFQRLIWAALAVALVVGSAQTGVQSLQATQLILAAEVYEGQKAEAPAPAISSPSAPADTSAMHTHAEGVAAHGHDHGVADEWEPENGAERLIWTWLANALHAFSMALLMFAVMGIWLYRRGAAVSALRLATFVAAAGWLSFNLWPSLGLHAEVPGMEVAPLRLRQAWWVLAMGCAAGACAAVAFARGGWRWAVAVALLALPFVVGAPHVDGDVLAGFGPEAHAALEQLNRQFVWATHWVALSFWVCMGLAGGLAFQRWVRPALLAVLQEPEQATSTVAADAR